VGPHDGLQNEQQPVPLAAKETGIDLDGLMAAGQAITQAMGRRSGSRVAQARAPVAC